MNNSMPGLVSPPASERRSTITTVAALLQCTNLGGMEKVAYSLFDQLQPRGFNIRVSTPRPWGPGKERVLKNDPMAQSFDYRGKFGWRSFSAFSGHAQALGGTCERVWVIGTCVSCLRAARLSGRKTLLSHHYHHFENRASWLRWTAFYCAFGAGLDAITYPTEFTRNEALRIAPWLRKKMHVVRNGFDVHYSDETERLKARVAARKALGMPEDAFLVGNGGWLILRKRFDVFLETAAQVARQMPNAEFYICGGGPEEANLRALSQKLGIAGKVHFTGWVSDLTRYYQAWDALLFNSDFDALGCTPLEAASHGTLCAASCRHGGLSEFLEDGKTGVFMREHDPVKLASALVMLARNTSVALEFRQQAVEMLKCKFNNDKPLSFYEDYFKRTG